MSKSYIDSTIASVDGSKPSHYVIAHIYIDEFNRDAPDVVTDTWVWHLVIDKACMNLVGYGNVDYSTFFFDYPMAVGPGRGNGPTYQYSVPDSALSYPISGVEYKDVYEVHHYSNNYFDPTYTNTTRNRWFYINKHEGIVKMRARCLDSVYHIWKLQRSYIVK